MNDLHVVTIYYLPCHDGNYSACALTPSGQACEGPSGCAGPPEKGYGLYLRNLDFPALSHELSHYFCLIHPFTQADRAEAGLPVGQQVSHDADCLVDTPPDPSGPEGALTTDPQTDKDKADMVLVPNWTWVPTIPNIPNADIAYYHNGHEWCYINLLTSDPGSPLLASPFPGYGHCDPICYSREGGATSQTAFVPDTSIAVSYYFRGCLGPNVLNGWRHEAFSPTQVSEVKTCWQTLPERTVLTHVCDTLGGDTDSDGFCGTQDNCPTTWQPDQADTEGDGIGNACDLCPEAPGTNADGDKDGIGDDCDPDNDNDGCPNATDDDPTDDRQVIGTRHLQGCGETIIRPWTDFAGKDSDGDGVLNCDVAETDDDHDGTPDVVDPCPTVSGVTPPLCMKTDGYPPDHR